MLGPSNMRSMQVWVMMASQDDDVRVHFWLAGAEKNAKPARKMTMPAYAINNPSGYAILKFECGGLEPGQTYVYRVSAKLAGGKLQSREGQFHTPPLFQWRTDPPTVNLITGSCYYANEPEYDRPGKPYGGDSSIFVPMAAEHADLMLWLGDNWYTRDVDYTTAYGLWYRPAHDRQGAVLQPLLANTPNLAIWDDHDYGPNDYSRSYFLKQTSREVFQSFWLNPSSGFNDQGIFTRYQLSDIDFFLMDNRWWRSFDDLPDSINGKPNPQKAMWGKEQLEWLKDELRISKGNPFVNFRIVVTGSQVLNPVSPFDKMLDFPAEYADFMNFLREEKIDGVLFMTGDRHHSEIIKVQPNGMYPLFDITCSPLTSGTHVFGGKEANNPYRVLGVDQLQNYGKINVSGPRNNRVMTVEYKGVKGENLGTYTIQANALRF